MGNIRYVVAGLPRSGTKYIAKVLTSMSLDCGHERHFGYEKATVERTEDGIWGDASWMSVPYLKGLPPGTVVFHQLRNPINVLNSNLPPDGDSYFRTWDENAGLESDPLYNKSIPWKRFIWDTTQDWVWPEGAAEEHEGPGEIQRLIHWWMNWNLWIESAVLRRADLQYIRYRLEDLTTENWTLLQDICKVIDPEHTKGEGEIKAVLGDISCTTNRHREPNTRITTSMLPVVAQLTMMRYGYDSIQKSAV
ncbi:hypothetical protein LCGC14_0244700 [marine sediment metagenome]|uniref:Sulfotransferase domain-containing protein n=1 Tax=marine sediment metagenome TaxID=412755 RepID=A0A0F9XB41_9ZZZZ